MLPMTTASTADRPRSRLNVIDYQGGGVPDFVRTGSKGKIVLQHDNTMPGRAADNNDISQRGKHRRSTTL